LAANRDNWLKALTDAAAASLGPIASILVEQAAADGAPFDDVRRRLATQMDEAARERFLKATDALSAGARSVPARAEALRAAPQPAPPPGPISDMLDGRDPAFVKALARDLANRLGSKGETLVLEAARRCRTKAQLCVRLASQVEDPELKALLSKLALDDPRLSGPKPS
jgi:hypothetical protein